MMHPDTELRWVGDEIGVGVVATRDLPMGTIVWALDPLDRAFWPEQVGRLDPLYRATFDRYAYTNAEGQLVLCWDRARFVNHSCEANCLGGGFPFEIAVRDIGAGEELTDDYGTLFLEEALVCCCGSSRCRGVVKGDDALRLAPEWDARLAEAASRLGSVPQPLWPLLEDVEQVTRVLADPSLLPRHPTRLRRPRPNG